MPTSQAGIPIFVSFLLCWSSLVPIFLATSTLSFVVWWHWTSLVIPCPYQNLEFKIQNNVLEFKIQNNVSGTPAFLAVISSPETWRSFFRQAEQPISCLSEKIGVKCSLYEVGHFKVDSLPRHHTRKSSATFSAYVLCDPPSVHQTSMPLSLPVPIPY